MSDAQSIERERLAQERLPAIERERDQLRMQLERSESARNKYANMVLELRDEIEAMKRTGGEHA